MTLGVVIPCHRQERWLPRTVAALERALAGREWEGVIVISGPSPEPAPAPLPPLGSSWRVLRPVVDRPLTPGAARNLGFAACGGEWVLFVDADVEVDPEWLARAGQVAAAGGVAGLWGRIEEWFEDGGRERPGTRDLYRVGDRDHDSHYVATLAFYRRDALEAVGRYEPRLASEEDFELGLRLRRAGHVLRAITPRAARHWSAPRPTFAELGRRWRTGLCFGQGQVLRLYLGRAGLGEHLARQALYVATLALWLAAPLAAALGGGRGLAAWAAAVVALVAAMAVRKHDLRLGVLAVATWTVNAAGMVVGFARGGITPQVVTRWETA